MNESPQPDELLAEFYHFLVSAFGNWVIEHNHEDKIHDLDVLDVGDPVVAQFWDDLSSGMIEFDLRGGQDYAPAIRALGELILARAAGRLQ